jgi:peroxiredoxin
MISVDPIEGEKGNKAFAEAHKADFPLLSDPTKQTATAYGVLRDFFLAPFRSGGRSISGREDRLHR